MLKIYLINNRQKEGGILRENLTSIQTDHADLREHLPELIRLCKVNQGSGVAANQVGIRSNFFFVSEAGKFPNRKGGAPTSHLCVNPTWDVAPKSGKTTKGEGCLSIPGRSFLVERHDVILAEWTNAVGHREKKKLKGWAARVFQHEHDHLLGVLISDEGKGEEVQ